MRWRRSDTEKGLPYFDLAVEGPVRRRGRAAPEAGGNGRAAGQGRRCADLPVRGRACRGRACPARGAHPRLQTRAAARRRALREAAQPGGITATASEGDDGAAPRSSCWRCRSGEAGFTLAHRHGRAPLPGAERTGGERPSRRCRDRHADRGGRRRLHPRLHRAMEGMAPGDSRDIEVAFPADYGRRAGRQAGPPSPAPAKALKTPQAARGGTTSWPRPWAWRTWRS